ncbi:MAG: helix-turn-helix transcriptional regulator, partial [bacterium]
FVFKYIYVNIFDFRHGSGFYVEVFIWRTTMFVIWMGITYSFLNVVAELKGIELSINIKKYLQTAAVIFMIGYISGLVFKVISDSPFVFYAVDGTAGVGMLVLIIIALIKLWRTIPVKSLSCAKQIKFFLVCFLPGFAAYLVIVISPLDKNIFLSINRFYLVVVSFLWLDYNYLKNAKVISASFNVNDLLKHFEEACEFSNREKEVLTLMLNGKSNAQIEETLFISQSTVRNHVSALYKKIGVSGRGELMSKVLEIKKTL